MHILWLFVAGLIGMIFGMIFLVLFFKFCLERIVQTLIGRMLW